ncbi:hypothetical protein HPB52_004078 [Rhipicephalus sanguineus]|uniref:CCHC-type domain-containing protein n=1 Tax=Rhipicephalus sanguineus TaxID=34632 RepID=A0A9D4SXL5_RHISA|nr:hypothetical protein HPB52_004078 [Rhipicephalus sanguineus]
MSMQVTVEGEDISPEECMQSGWTTAISKRKTQGTPAQGGQTHSSQRGGGIGGARTPAGVKKRIIAASRLPPLPRENYRIIVRPRGGLNVKNVSQIKVAHALASAAQLAPAEIANDIVCSNVMQNIFVVSTPEEKNARAYSKVELITVGGANYEVGSYLAAPDNTCKGVVKGVDLDFSEEEVTDMIVHPRNPTALEVKRIRNTTTVVVLFDGLKVPNYVVCGPSMLRCTLYRRQTDVCYACGRLGHRADVCPTPENTICRGCGIESPTEDHVCTPECALCGGPHPTADKSCKQRFHMPYIVRRRRRERQKVKSPASPIRERAQSRSSSRGRSEMPRSRSKSRSSSRGRSRSKGPPTVRIHEPPAPGPTEWADRVKGTASRVRRASSPPPEHSAARLLQLERENASLRNALEQLRAEMDEMKRAGQGQPVQRPLPPVTERAETPIETLMEIPAETPAPRRPAKKRALSQPILDEGIDELRAELRGFQSELRDALKALSEAVSAMNARVDSVESKMTITDQLSGSVVRTASPSVGSSTARAFQNSPQLASDHGVSDDRLIDGRNHGGSR